MKNYFRNASGFRDPTAGEAIRRVSVKEKEISKKVRNKQVHDTISAIKDILDERDLKLMGRMILRDKKNGREYK